MALLRLGSLNIVNARGPPHPYSPAAAWCDGGGGLTSCMPCRPHARTHTFHTSRHIPLISHLWALLTGSSAFLNAAAPQFLYQFSFYTGWQMMRWSTLCDVCPHRHVLFHPGVFFLRQNGGSRHRSPGFFGVFLPPDFLFRHNGLPSRIPSSLAKGPPCIVQIVCCAPSAPTPGWHAHAAT